MGTHRTRMSRLAFRLLEVGLALVFLGAVAQHVYTLDFKPLAALCLPILVVFYGFAAVLYTRGRALAKGREQTRSLYAAERAMQATIWHLFGIILGLTLYALLMRFGAGGPWLLLFLAPYALMQIALICFMRAIWAITPHFFRRVGAFELRKRIQQ